MTFPRPAFRNPALFLALACFAAACSPRTRPVVTAAPALWEDLPDTAIRHGGVPRPARYRLLRLNDTLMHRLLAAAAASETSIPMPLPEGTNQDFRVSESSLAAPALLKKYPHLRTYNGRGVDTPSATAKLDFVSGFHAYLFMPAGSVIIDPVQGANPAEITNTYICYYKHDAQIPRDEFEFRADSVLHRE